MSTRLFALALAALVASQFADASDQGVNAVYERMQAAYASLDAAKLETVYSPDATYLPGSPKANVNNRQAIQRGLGGFIDKVRANNGRIEVSFRIVERKRFDGIFIDNGYVRSVIDYGDGKPPVVSNGKFQTAIVRQPDGKWAFVSDSDSETPPASYDKAKPLVGVKFDE